MKKRESTSQRRRRGPLAAAGLTVMTLVAMTGIHELMAHGTEARRVVTLNWPKDRITRVLDVNRNPTLHSPPPSVARRDPPSPPRRPLPSPKLSMPDTRIGRRRVRPARACYSSAAPPAGQTCAHGTPGCGLCRWLS